MQPRYTPTRIGMAIVGGGVVLADTSLNMANQYAQSGLRIDLLGLTLMLAISTTFGTYAVVELLKSPSAYEKICAGVVGLAVVFGMSYSFQHSVSRYTNVYQGALKREAVVEKARRMEVSQDFVEASAIEDQIASEGLMTKIAEECVDNLSIRQADGEVKHYKNVRYSPDSPFAGHFKRCVMFKERYDELRRQKLMMLGRLNALTEVSLWEVDDAARTMALYFPWWTPEQISTYIPGLPAIALMLFSIMFGLGLSGERVQPKFSFALTGDAKLTSDGEEFILGYKDANKAWPNKTVVSEAVPGLSPQRAATILQRLKRRKKK